MLAPDECAKAITEALNTLALLASREGIGVIRADYADEEALWDKLRLAITGWIKAVRSLSTAPPTMDMPRALVLLEHLCQLLPSVSLKQDASVESLCELARSTLESFGMATTPEEWSQLVVDARRAAAKGSS